MGADFGDRADSENADRDFITSLDAMVIKAADGRVVWDMNWEFLDASWGSRRGQDRWRVAIDGNASVLSNLTGMLDEPDPTLAIVTS